MIFHTSNLHLLDSVGQGKKTCDHVCCILERQAYMHFGQYQASSWDAHFVDTSDIYEVHEFESFFVTQLFTVCYIYMYCQSHCLSHTCTSTFIYSVTPIFKIYLRYIVLKSALWAWWCRQNMTPMSYDIKRLKLWSQIQLEACYHPEVI